jgi:Kef-type K+ transport system membrane component KefB
MEIFIELSAIIVLATAVSCVMRLLKQPLVVGYILTGILVGPYAFDILQSVEFVELFSKFGIAILLFIVGLGLNPIVIKEVGKVSLITGIGQVVFTTVIGFLIVRALGYDTVASLCIAVALTLSSTIIILKLLSDKNDLGKLYGKIAVGFLLVQDLIAVVILLAISTLSTSEGIGVTSILSALMLKGVLAAALVFLVSRFLLPKLSNFFAASQELLFMFSLAWGLGMASLFWWLGFSVEIGALVAGVSLALSPFAYEIGARMKPLRDFFILLFFILLGAQIFIGGIKELLLPAIILSLYVLIGNPLIMLVLMNMLGYKRKVGFMAGLTVAQISEFSLILVSMAFAAGYVTREVVSLVTLVGIVTIAGSSYLIIYSEKIYHTAEPFLKFFDMPGRQKRMRSSSDAHYRVLIFGYDRVGSDFVKAAEKLGEKYLVIDFNPASIGKLQEENVPFRYGDAEDTEFLGELNLQDVKLIISTVPDFNASMVLVKTYRKVNAAGIIIVLSHDVNHARELYLAGASYVVMPHHLGAHHAAQMVSKHGFDSVEFERERNLHLQKLAKRK